VSSSPALSDEQLLQAFVDSGNQLAFQELYGRHAEPLQNYISKRYFNGDIALAEDAAQQTFLKLAQEASELDLNRPLRPWLYLVASNCAIDLQRNRLRRPAVSLSILQMTTAAESSFSSNADFDIEDTETPDAAEEAETNETMALAQSVLSNLSDADRAVADAVYGSGLTFVEAAERLNMPVGSLKTRVHRMLSILRKRIAA
jgi:RNA polymerase sigma-70 factor (ECF subfamily)